MDLGPTTPVNIYKFIDLLDGYPHHIQIYLLKGFTEGFFTGWAGKLVSNINQNVTNHASALRHPDTVDQKLDKEKRANRIIGPFDSPPFKIFFHIPTRIEGKERTKCLLPHP